MSSSTPAPKGLHVWFDKVDLRLPTAGGSVEILKEISFQLAPGSFVCLLGSSGAGKSSLVRLLLGDVQAAAGRILFDGRTPTQEDFESIGYVPQNPIVHGALTVGKALAYAARLRRPDNTPDSDIAEAVREVEKALGIESRHDLPIASLSGGESKRVSLAAELLARPRLLVVDEATSSLDPAADLRIMRHLADLARAQGTTILCVTHHMENADLADNLMIVHLGRLVWWGHRAEALRHFKVERLTQIFIQLEDGGGEPAIPPIPTTPPEGGARAAQHTARIEHGFLPQFLLLFRRNLDVFLSDRRTLLMSVLVPLFMVILGFLGFAREDFNHPSVLTRPLNSEERETLIEAWGTVQDALKKERVSMSGDFSDLSVPMQLRVYLEANPQIKEYLGSEGLARTVKASLAGEVPLIPVATISNYWPTYKLQFTVLFGVMLLGFMVGVGAIVGERPVLLREVPSGLRPDAYVASRFALAGFILLVQTLAGVVPLNLMFDASQNWNQTGPVSAYQQPLAVQLVFQWLAGCACAGMGLMVSAIVRSRGQALSMVPLLILPQLLLGGLILPLHEGFLRVLAQLLAPSYWGFRGIAIQDPSWPVEWRIFGDISRGLTIPFLALLLQIAVTAVLTSLLLRRNLKR
jgi:ABC-type multidrug transport system ATPase subunit